ncbi:DUF3576 domain-containing protein [Pseudooceanicola sp. CBS1P-1]|uniref:DUF3576 domain-containing protein n=1 Tax=Pseudooceanicola albus TaxID=2692189 RepID=A0A6L7G1Z1_9RHOB|nr:MULTISPECIES: DUF3576 domain-containing protein [Pseudooceanicola]MBT9383995.1 DUF3576 domain-containing protein [Pseudooceanicola endophyticus]MXN16593.1 DUF3576 domain-containing protein [Pseudooceanicola albus]
MMSSGAIRLLAIGSLVVLGACSGQNNVFKNGNDVDAQLAEKQRIREGRSEGKIWDLFKQRDDGSKVAVNRYLWNASLDVLDFLPIEAVDPFTGVISTGYGTPPGGSARYRATVLISDPALEARSLNVTLENANGRPVDAATQRAVEDAILTRARQLLKADRGR